MFGLQKMIKKEKKNVKENDFFVFGFIMKKINIIKIIQKFVYLKII